MKYDCKIPFFKRGDIGGLAYIIPNNIVNYLIIIATLKYVLGWPDEIIFGFVIPGISIGLFVGCLYYAWMAYKLSKKEDRGDITALPSGVSTPAMFVILYGVVMPLSYALEDPRLAWSAGMAACFIGGFVEFLGGFIGPWMKKHIPRPALLGTVAGIGFIWMATQGTFDILADPVIGIPVAIVAMVGVFGNYLFPKKIPPLVIAIVGGVVYSFCLGRANVDFSGIGLYIPNPVTSIQCLISGISIVAPYLAIVIPVEIYNFIETMDNVEGANANGDDFNVREAQWADGICTMISALFGSVVPNTVWLGHVSMKKTDAGLGYSVVSGIILLLSGLFGIFTFLSEIVPTSVYAITFLWCAADMVSQAFGVCDKKHYSAIAVAMVPSVADYLYTQVTGSVGIAGYWTEKVSSGLSDFTPEVYQMVVDSGVMWNGVAATKAGAIVIGIILGTIVVFIIDRKFLSVTFTCLAAAFLAFVGMIHAAEIGINILSSWGIGYLITAVVALILYAMNKKGMLLDSDGTPLIEEK